MVDSRYGPPTCRLCWGGECWGGGNKACPQRDPRPSHIAAILDTYGGIRVVVSHKSELKHHVKHDEVLIIVPGKLVHTPIAWGDIPHVIALAEHYAKKWAEEGRPNEEHAVTAAQMYRLRCLEYKQRSLDLNSIVET